MVFENIEKFNMESLILKQDSSDTDEEIQELIDVRPKKSQEVAIKVKSKLFKY
jgi:hypothetical protein